MYRIFPILLPKTGTRIEWDIPRGGEVQKTRCFRDDVRWRSKRLRLRKRDGALSAFMATAAAARRPFFLSRIESGDWGPHRIGIQFTNHRSFFWRLEGEKGNNCPLPPFSALLVQLLSGGGPTRSHHLRKRQKEGGSCIENVLFGRVERMFSKTSAPSM